VTKHSWKGRYQRVFCVCTDGCVTLHPQTLAVTNAWAFGEDPDITAVALGASDGALPEFVLTCRNDKKSKFKPTTFSTAARAPLLSDLYRALAHAAGGARSPVPRGLAGAPREWECLKYRASRGAWEPCVLRATAFSLERLEPRTRLVKWRVLYVHLASPSFQALAGEPGQPAGLFAVAAASGDRPRVFASPARPDILRAVAREAQERLGAISVMGHGEAFTLEALLQSHDRWAAPGTPRAAPRPGAPAPAGFPPPPAGRAAPAPAPAPRPAGRSRRRRSRRRTRPCGSGRCRGSGRTRSSWRTGGGSGSSGPRGGTRPRRRSGTWPRLSRGGSC